MFVVSKGLKSPIFVMGPKPPTREYESWLRILQAFTVLCLVVIAVLQLNGCICMNKTEIYEYL